MFLFLLRLIKYCCLVAGCMLTCELSAQTLAMQDTLLGRLMFVIGGTFDMGCRECIVDAITVHKVTVSDFYMGETEVTQAQWRTVMGNNPSWFAGCDACPVEVVSWNDVQDFLQKINLRSDSLRYRLPTEAEWEYAARGGEKSNGYAFAGNDTLDVVGWYENNSEAKPHPVKGKMPNELGLYDMSGNVYEWCSDWYGPYGTKAEINPTGSTFEHKHVIRGGAWITPDPRCHVSNRGMYGPEEKRYYLGFRVVLASALR